MRRLAAAGRDRAELAAEFGCTRRHVDRLVRGDQRATIPTQDGPTVRALREYLAALELDAADRVLAAAAEALAAKLDAVRLSDSAASAGVAPGLARQLGETLREVRGEREDVAATVQRMLEPLVRGRA